MTPQGDRSPKGGNREDGFRAQHESAGREAMRQTSPKRKDNEMTEDLIARLRGELQRQCSAGAGVFHEDHEVGLWQVSADLDPNGLAQAILTTLEASRSEMPTIWEDPAGKGYPCFERPMTAKEAREEVETLRARVVELEASRTPVSEERAKAAYLEALWSGWRSGLAGEQMDEAYAEESWHRSDAAQPITGENAA